MIYKINDNYSEIKDVLNDNSKFIGKFKNEENDKIARLYNFIPCTILLYPDKIEIVSKTRLGENHINSRLEKMLGEIE